MGSPIKPGQVTIKTFMIWDNGTDRGAGGLRHRWRQPGARPNSTRTGPKSGTSVIKSFCTGATYASEWLQTGEHGSRLDSLDVIFLSWHFNDFKQKLSDYKQQRRIKNHYVVVLGSCTMYLTDSKRNTYFMMEKCKPACFVWDTYKFCLLKDLCQNSGEKTKMDQLFKSESVGNWLTVNVQYTLASACDSHHSSLVYLFPGPWSQNYRRWRFQCGAVRR
jgi:hypothetical protein